MKIKLFKQFDENDCGAACVKMLMYAILPVDFVSSVQNAEIVNEIVLVEYDSHWIEEAYRIKGLDYNGTHGHYDWP